MIPEAKSRCANGFADLRPRRHRHAQRRTPAKVESQLILVSHVVIADLSVAVLSLSGGIHRQPQSFGRGRDYSTADFGNIPCRTDGVPKPIFDTHVQPVELKFGTYVLNASREMRYNFNVSSVYMRVLLWTLRGMDIAAFALSSEGGLPL